MEGSKVPYYTVRCPEHGDHEVFRKIDSRVFYCENAEWKNPLRPNLGRRRCYWPVQQIITREALPGVRIDCAGEDSANPDRIADGSAGFNVGLRGVDKVVGTRPDGKPKLAYRPLTNKEVGSNRNRQEIAKRQGLIAAGEGAYRTVVR